MIPFRMQYGHPWLSMIRQEVERTMRKRHKPPRVGFISSWDPARHAAKVQLQPEGTETGWIPLTAAGTGNGFGVVIAPNIKDQVEVHFQEGDQMVPRVTTRHFSKGVDTAPVAQAGEIHAIHGSGAALQFLQDGSVKLSGANTIATGSIGGGKSGNFSTDKSGQGQVDNPNQQGSQQQPAKPNAKQSIQFNTSGDITITAVNGKVTITDSAGSTVVFNGDGNIQVIPGGGKIFLGGNGSDGVYGKVVTDKGPAANTMAKVG